MTPCRVVGPWTGERDRGPWTGERDSGHGPASGTAAENRARE